MDLAKEFKAALKDPFRFKSLLIIFLVVFIVLITSLSMTVVVKNITNFSSQTTACSTPKSMTTKGSVKASTDSIYKIKFTGNDKCFIQAWFTWEKTSDQINLWVYDPKGNVTIIEPLKSQAYIDFTTHSPLIKGDWRLILKSVDNATVPYNGEIAVR